MLSYLAGLRPGRLPDMSEPVADLQDLSKTWYLRLRRGFPRTMEFGLQTAGLYS